MKNDKRNIELRERLLNFSVSVFNMLKELPHRKEYDVLRYQLSKSATSIGANYEESQSSTYREFYQRIKIALREANETIYWLKITEKLKISSEDKIRSLINEAVEISRILGAIASKTDKKIKGE